MNIQDERVHSACEQLALKAVADQYAQLAQEAVRNDHSYCDYLEHYLNAERDSRRVRSLAMLARMAGFPAIKLLDDYDFRFAQGAPKKAIQDLASLAFIERKEQRHPARAQWRGQDPSSHCAGLSGHPRRHQGAFYHRSGPGNATGESPTSGAAGNTDEAIIHVAQCVDH